MGVEVELEAVGLLGFLKEVLPVIGFLSFLRAASRLLLYC